MTLQKPSLIVGFLVGIALAPGETAAQPAHPFGPGEVLTYDVSYLWPLMGSLRAEVVEKLDFEKTPAYHLTSQVQIGGGHVQNWIDVVCLSEDLLPLRIKTIFIRNGLRADGLQLYYPQAKKAIFSQTTGRKTTSETFTRVNPIQDLATIIYYFRTLDLESARPVSVSLKQGEFVVEMTGVDTLMTALSSEPMPTFVLQSTPPLIKVWLSQNEKKYPLRVETGTGLGKSTMVLKKVQNSSN